MTDEKFKELVAKAKARYDAMTPEQQAEHDKAQRESWVRGEMGFPKPKYHYDEHGVKIYDSYEDYCNG